MLERRRLCNDFKPGKNGSNRISGGPGTLSQAMGIQVADSGVSLQGNRIWLEDNGLAIDNALISAAPRIGVDFAGEDALLPYRFTLDHVNALH
jgi:DNA-3-methyladenine glycosylase